jgi:hypothetical protein
MDFLKQLTNAVMGSLPNSIVGEVIAVDAQALTCDIKPNGGYAPLLDVRLRSTVNVDDAGNALPSRAQGVYALPKVGSYVLAEPIGKQSAAYYVSAYSEVDKVLIIIGDTQIEMEAPRIAIDSDKVSFNQGTNGGLVLVSPLVNKLNSLTQKVNELETLLATHVHTSAAPGTPTTPPVPVIVPSPIAPAAVSELSNPNIEH